MLVGLDTSMVAELVECAECRLFGATGYCSACSKMIPAFEMVMKAKGNVYHLECFACQQCSHRLNSYLLVIFSTTEQRDCEVKHPGIYRPIYTLCLTRSSAMVEGPRDALVSMEKSLQSMNDTPKVITVSAIKSSYGISLPVCGLLFQRLYLGPFSRLYHF